MSVKVFNSQIGHISSSFFKHVGVSKSLKWKFSWWPWTGSVFNFKKQKIIKLSILISSLRCSPFRGYLYICRILLGSPSTTRWKTPKNLKRRIAGSVVDSSSSYRRHIDLCIISHKTARVVKSCPPCTLFQSIANRQQHNFTIVS